MVAGLLGKKRVREKKHINAFLLPCCCVRIYFVLLAPFSLPRSSDFPSSPCRPRASISPVAAEAFIKMREKTVAAAAVLVLLLLALKSQLPSRKNQRERTIADVCKTQKEKTLFHLRIAKRKKSLGTNNKKH